MRTETLIDMLARNAGPAPRALAAKRLCPVMAAGLLASGWAAIVWFGLIPWSLFGTPVPWTKIVYASALAAASGWWVPDESSTEAGRGSGVSQGRQR